MRLSARSVFNEQSCNTQLVSGQTLQFYKLFPFPWILLLDQCNGDYGTEYFRASMLNSLHIILHTYAVPDKHNTKRR